MRREPKRQAPLRVCEVTTTFPSRQRPEDPPFVLHLCKALAATGLRITVLTQAIGTQSSQETYEGLEVERFSYFWPFRLQRLHGGLPAAVRGSFLAKLQVPFLLLRMHSRLRTQVRRGCDLIHAHWAFPSGWVAGRVGRALGVPVVLTVHGSDVFESAPLLRWFARQSLTKASAITANSSATTAMIEEILPSARCRIIGMPVEVPPISDVQSVIKDPGLVVAVGRLVEVKGHRVLVAAFSRVLRQLPQARLKIIGGGPEFESLRRQILDHFGKGEVELLGPLPHPDVLSWIRKANLLVQPSIESHHGAREALGVTVLEAMAQGTVVLASRCGGIAEIVRNGETGFLVSPGDEEELALRLIELLALDHRPDVLPQAHAEVQRRYSPEAVSAEFVECFERAMEAGKGPRIEH